MNTIMAMIIGSLKTLTIITTTTMFPPITRLHIIKHTNTTTILIMNNMIHKKRQVLPEDSDSQVRNSLRKTIQMIHINLMVVIWRIEMIQWQLLRYLISLMIKIKTESGFQIWLQEQTKLDLVQEGKQSQILFKSMME